MEQRKPKKARMIIYAVDVVEITGKSYKTALRLLIAVRIFYDKPPGTFVSYREFCAFMGLDEQEVLEMLNK
ncbi:hypothetical protein [Myroides fluvii]|uniref:hypothetical protein n=1 Tax=Myroides fluvii TaxID=2572594 RepID=UPI00131DBF7E|nr:hypothetical protein [Myroides fluvii]